MKLYIKKIFCFLLGCFIIQIGCAAFINANTGGDSCVVFIQGISKALNITVGSANYIFMFCALVLLLIFARNKTVFYYYFMQAAIQNLPFHQLQSSKSCYE